MCFCDEHDCEPVYCQNCGHSAGFECEFFTEELIEAERLCANCHKEHYSGKGGLSIGQKRLISIALDKIKLININRNYISKKERLWNAQGAISAFYHFEHGEHEGAIFNRLTGLSLSVYLRKKRLASLTRAEYEISPLTALAHNQWALEVLRND